MTPRLTESIDHEASIGLDPPFTGDRFVERSQSREQYLHAAGVGDAILARQDAEQLLTVGGQDLKAGQLRRGTFTCHQNFSKARIRSYEAGASTVREAKASEELTPYPPLPDVLEFVAVSASRTFGR